MRVCWLLSTMILVPLVAGQDINWADGEYKRGKELFQKEAFSESEQAFKNALQVYRAKSDKKWELNSLQFLAKLLGKSKRYDEAISANLECLSLATTLNDTNGIGYANNRLGTIYFSREDYATAATYFQAALIQSRLTGTHDDIKIDLQNLIDTYKELQNVDEASKYQAEKNQLDGGTGPDALTITEADQLKKSGEEKMKRGDYADAIEDLLSALAFYRVKGDEQYLKLTAENAARCQYFLGQYEQAIGLANEALLLAQKTNDHYGQGVDQNTIGMCLYYKGRQSDALDCFTAAYRLNVMDGSSKIELKTSSYFLSVIYKKMGDYAAAAPYEQTYHQLTAQGY